MAVQPGGTRGPGGHGARSSRARKADEGFSLLEMVVILLVMGILLGITIPIVSTVLQTSSKVNVTYSNVDEQLWLSTTLQRLVRAAVAPGPSVTGSIPVAAFVPGTISPTSMAFYTDAGTARGPEKVVAKCTPTASTSQLCAKGSSTFSVVMYRAEVTPSTGASFCPRISGTTAKKCLYTTTTANGKSLTITSRTLVSIPNVRNGTNGKVLFVYTYAIPASTTSAKPTVRRVLPAQDSIFTTCTPGTTLATFNNCPAGEIESVTYDLQINGRVTSLYGGAQAEDDTGIFVLSSTSMGYEPSVG